MRILNSLMARVANSEFVWNKSRPHADSSLVSCTVSQHILILIQLFFLFVFVTGGYWCVFGPISFLNLNKRPNIIFFKRFFMRTRIVRILFPYTVCEFSLQLPFLPFRFILVFRRFLLSYYTFQWLSFHFDNFNWSSRYNLDFWSPLSQTWADWIASLEGKRFISICGQIRINILQNTEIKI